MALALGGAFVGQASTAGPGGWDHLGDGGTPGTQSLNGNVLALNADAPGSLLVGGSFTGAGGNANANRIASWNGSAWSAVGSAKSQISDGAVFAIAYAGGKVYAGGSFHDAGGNLDADFLAVWDGASWAPFCTPAAGGPAFGGNVKALQVIGPTLYVGGEFNDGAGIASADSLLACDMSTGSPSATVNPTTTRPFSGPVLALTADSNGVLYAGGRFLNLENISAADNVAYRDNQGWHAMGSGGGTCGCAIDGFVRSLAATGTDVFVGTDVKDVAGITQADNVVRWNGSAWSAVGADSSGANGWFTTSASVYGLTTFGSNVYATGSFQDANGDPLADNVAAFDGSAWHAVGSNGAGNGPWNVDGSALAVFDQHRLNGAPLKLYAGGGFTSAGGDAQARSVASFPLSQTLPPPVVGQTANARPVSGTVQVQVVGSKKFVPLINPEQVRFGTIFDTRKGTVEIVIANGHGGFDKAQFSEGVFRLVQKKGARPIAELQLVGGTFKGCPKAAKGGAAAAGKPRGRSVRHLWGNGSGGFRTKGRFASATIRGTKWLTDDRCKGTLARVAIGAVTVRDFVKRKSVVVKAPKSYFARA